MSPTKTNPEVTDTTSQLNAQVVATAPAVALGTLYQNLANSASMAAMNAVYAQQQAFIAHQAVTARNVEMLLSLLDQ